MERVPHKLSYIVLRPFFYSVFFVFFFFGLCKLQTLLKREQFESHSLRHRHVTFRVNILFSRVYSNSSGEDLVGYPSRMPAENIELLGQHGSGPDKPDNVTGYVNGYWV